MYTGFAEVYDQLMDDVHYEAWAESYLALLSSYGITGGKLCECACGTGSLTIPLSRGNFHITGIDLSQEMLWIASQKARKAGLAIPFVRQDMRQMRLHRPMDAVLATCDGVNYLLQDEDVLAFFQAAFAALRPGGVLAFDLSTPYKLQNVLGNEMICEDREDITYLWQNRYSPKTTTVDMHLCIFIREKDGHYRRIDEEQKQRAHTMESLFDLLTKAGFEDVRFFGASLKETAKDEDHRWHIAARKPLETKEGEEACLK